MRAKGFLPRFPSSECSFRLFLQRNLRNVENRPIALRALSRKNSGEPALVAALTRQTIRTCKANSSRVYIAGISAGGAAAAIIAAAYPELYVAVGVHSGLSR